MSRKKDLYGSKPLREYIVFLTDPNYQTITITVNAKTKEQAKAFALMEIAKNYGEDTVLSYQISGAKWLDHPTAPKDLW